MLKKTGGSLPLFFSAILCQSLTDSRISYPAKEENKGKEPPQFMSTHPSSSKRIKDLSEWENSVILDYPPITIG